MSIKCCCWFRTAVLNLG